MKSTIITPVNIIWDKTKKEIRYFVILDYIHRSYIYLVNSICLYSSINNFIIFIRLKNRWKSILIITPSSNVNEHLRKVLLFL